MGAEQQPSLQGATNHPCAEPTESRIGYGSFGSMGTDSQPQMKAMLSFARKSRVASLALAFLALVDTGHAVAESPFTVPVEFVDVRDIIEALALVPGLPSGSELYQAASGELMLDAPGVRGRLLPVRMSQAAQGVAAGIYGDGDGNIVLVTEEGHQVLVYPLLLADDAFHTSLAEQGFKFAYDDKGQLIVEAMEEPFFAYYTGRARALAVPVSGKAAGLQASGTGYSLVFEDEDGQLMEQEIIAFPADWPNLRDALAQLPDVTDVTLGATGDIKVEVNGRIVRGHVSHRVGQSILDISHRVLLFASEDLNADGTGDYSILFLETPAQRRKKPGPWVQRLYIYP